MNKILGLVCTTVLCGVYYSVAQKPAVWTYNDCVEYARQHNISLQQSLLNRQTTDLNLEASKAQWEPSLDFGTSHSFSNSPWGDGKINSLGGNFNLNAAWSVYDGGIRSNSIRLNKKQQQIDDLNSEDIFREIRTGILSAYLNILYAEESVEIYRNALQISTSQAERGLGLMEAGKLSKVDYSQLDAQRQQDIYSLVNAESLLATRKLELKKILQLGVADSVLIAPLPEDFFSIPSPLPPIEETFQLAAQQDPQLRSLNLKEEQADLNIDIAKGGRRPKIGLTAGVGTSYYIPGGGFGTQLKKAFGEQVGISLSLPIFDQRKTSTAVAKAKIDKLGIDLTSAERELDLSQLIESWYLSATESQNRYTAAISQREAAALSSELLDEKFKLGMVNPVELLTAHNNLLDASHSALQARFMSILAIKMIEFYRTSEIILPD